MKSFLPPVLLLLALLAFSMVNCGCIVRQTERWTGQLEEATALAAAEDWPGALEALSHSYRDWSAHQTYLHIVVRHEEVDGAEAMYRRAYAFGQVEEKSEFCAELADLTNQVRLLAEMERITVKNVL